MTPAASQDSAASTVDVVIVGAGFAGMYLIHKLRKEGFSVRAFEGGSGVGGTWYWNRYPGCRVDVVSMEYSYQFSEELQQEWEWSEKYATQPELLAYANHVADRFDLRKDIQFHTRVTAASYAEDSGRWMVRTDKGDSISAQFFILATGTLSTTNLPAFPGLDSFEGPTYHTGQWPHEPVDFTGKRVGIIGTGSSSCQSIPHLAEQAEHLTIFQRTANYVIPAHNEPVAAEEIQKIKANYNEFRQRNQQYPFAFFYETTNKTAQEVSDEEREREYEAAWQRGGLMFLGTFTDLITNHDSNVTAQAFFRRKLAEIVQDPETAKTLMPDFAIGCKRLIVGTDYYETYNRKNVTLVSVKDNPIENITPNGIVVNGTEHEFDAIVYATGFDAISGPITSIDIKGREGRSIRDKWADGARCYLGLMAAGFPNLFTITGPGSPSVLSNMIKSIEQHVEIVSDCIVDLRDKGHTVIEADADAEEAWRAHVDEIAEQTLYKSCNSWYLGSNIPGKPRVFTTYIGWPQYATEIEQVVADNYPGFIVDKPALAENA